MLVLKINYTKTLEHASKSVRYHAFRSRELTSEQKGVFSKDKDHADVAQFIQALDDPLTRPKQTRRGGEIRYAVMHRLMFSLSRQEFEACGFTSWKPVIREALRHVERYHGIELEWVAAEHQSRDHPHVHVDVKSVYTDAQGQRHRLRITQELRQHIRWSVEGVMKRERARVRADRLLQRDIQRAIARATAEQKRLVSHIGRTALGGLARAARGDHEPDPLQKKRRHPDERERRDEDRDR
jgi:hypothetical protein